jgi:predicted PurR-regulated permease PerM
LQLNRFYAFTLTLLSLVFGFLAYLIIKPFLTPILWAIVLTILFYPLYAFITKYIRWKPVASLITIAIIILLIIGPFSYVIIALSAELTHISSTFASGQLNIIVEKFEQQPVVAWVLDVIKRTFSIEDLDLVKIFQNNLAIVGKNLVDWVGISVKNIVSAVVGFIMMVFSLYFLLNDGPAFIERIKEYMPFSEPQKERLGARIRDMVISTIYGGVTVALCQGIVGGLTFFLLNISSPVLWGASMAVMSFVPMIGTFAIWGPATVILFIQGSILKSVILFMTGILIITMIDNVLKPVIIGGRTRMHTLVVFFSVLGGINLFGLIGLIMGPLVIVIFISIFEIFRHIEEEAAIIESPGTRE